MNKILWTVVSVLLILTAFCLITSAEELYRGDEISFTIQTDSFEEVKSGSIEFTYDGDQFEVIEGSWTLSTAPIVSDFKLGDGKGVFLYASPATVGGSVFTVKLRVKDTASFETSDVGVKVRFLNTANESSWVEYPLGTYTVLCRHAYTEQNTDERYFFSGATCTQPAVYYLSCSCGERGTETFTYGEPLGHRYDNSCDETCNVCGDTRVANHVYGSEYRKDASGHWKVCTSCGKETDRAPHEGPCDTVCRVCGISKPATHSYESVVTPATCTTAGYTTHTCRDCGHTYKDNHVPAKGHTPGAAANCERDQVCTACGVVLVSKTGHRYSSAVTPATCTTAGYTTHTCGDCGHTYKDSEVGAKGHTPGAEADCLHDQTCTACGEILTHKMGHDEVSHGAQAPSCTEIGWNTYVTCSRCEYTTYEELPAKGHTFGEWTQTTAPGCETDGEEKRACADCGLEESRVLESTGHRDENQDGVCDICGYGEPKETAAPETAGDDTAGDDTAEPDESKPEDTGNEETSSEASEGDDTDADEGFKLSFDSPLVRIGIYVLGAILIIVALALIIRKIRYL